MQGKLYCIAIVPILQCKTGSFIVQNRHFYNAKEPILQNLDNDIVTQEYRYSEILTLLFVF